MRLKASFRFAILTGAVVLASGTIVPARAQDPEDLKRGVARISLMEGEVSVRRGDSGEWVAGVINAPLLAEDRIATGQNSRAELQFDTANIMRIGGNAEINLTQLESGRYQVEIARGTVTYRILRQSNASVELNTPSVSVRPAKQGTFRITVNEAGETEITARAGDLEVFSPKGTQWVYAGQTMMARDAATDPEFQMVAAIPYDDWDRWNDTRDHSLLQSNSYQYVPQGVYGAEDLDAAGTWIYIAPYGYCWRPAVPLPGWSPYRYGRWVWEDWYGWTWVSSDPWGWAPYHYGRWFFDARYGWNWYPGVMGVRHYWSPALVAFFGYGSGFGLGVGFGFGNIGWVPLAPYEVFHPWWGAGFGGGLNRSFNITNVNVSATYRNARVASGIASVRSEDFSAGRFQNIQRPSGAQVQQAGLVSGRIPVNSTSATRRFSDVAATVPRASSATSRPAGAAGGQGSGAQSGFRRFGEPAGNSAGQSSRQAGTTSAPAQRQGGFERFGEPGSTQTAPRNDRPSSTPGSNGNWRSFGTPGISNPASRQPYNPPANRQSPAPGGRASSAPPANSARQRSVPGYSAPRAAAPAGSGHAPAPASRPSSSGSRGHR